MGGQTGQYLIGLPMPFQQKFGNSGFVRFSGIFRFLPRNRGDENMLFLHAICRIRARAALY